MFPKEEPNKYLPLAKILATISAPFEVNGPLVVFHVTASLEVEITLLLAPAT